MTQEDHAARPHRSDADDGRGEHSAGRMPHLDEVDRAIERIEKNAADVQQAAATVTI